MCQKTRVPDSLGCPDNLRSKLLTGARQRERERERERESERERERERKVKICPYGLPNHCQQQGIGLRTALIDFKKAKNQHCRGDGWGWGFQNPHRNESIATYKCGV